MDNSHFFASLQKTLASFFRLLPIVFGMLLLTVLALTFMPEAISSRIFGHGDLLDTLLGAALGGVSVGHPLASYILGG
jgi:hypothetical protein